MPKQLRIFQDKCIGCKSCELACSLFNEGEMNPAKARITQISFLGGKYPLLYNFVSTCRQCADAPCLSACPTSAILRSQDHTKRIIIEKSKCIGCGKCVVACPFGAMLYNREAKKAFKCELCGGDPACVRICPSNAIVFVKQKAFHAKHLDLQMQGIDILSTRNKAGTLRGKTD